MTSDTATTNAAAAAAPAERYHHGDLPNALRGAAAEVITEKGLGHFSLREVARRAGVSHAAPAHHFGDTTGLLTSLAVQGFDHLAQVLADATAGIDDPEDRLVAIGRGYVETGMRYPAHCQVMFRADVVDCDDPGYQEAGERAYAVLVDTVRAVGAAENLDLDVDMAADLCWSAMQGLLELYPNMVRRREASGLPPRDLEESITGFTRILLDGIRARRD
ncbi:MAG: TetR/AcrR family transcriptional regulator [Actinobacteria bacterium]|nr:TetR/AcrR family transcriptional regulator [Actinomycetota bacterium]